MDQEVKVSVRVGSGTKVHPAIALVCVTDEGKPWARKQYRLLHLSCHCPGTQSGHARHRAVIVADGWDKVTCLT